MTKCQREASFAKFEAFSNLKNIGTFSTIKKKKNEIRIIGDREIRQSIKKLLNLQVFRLSWPNLKIFSN